MRLELGKRIILALALVVPAALFGGTEAIAQQKGGGTPPPAPGTIYYDGYAKSTANNQYYWYRMRMDGGGGNKALAQYGVPSYQRHGGQHAFLFSDYDYTIPADDEYWAAPDPVVFARVYANGQWQEVRLTSAADPVRQTWDGGPVWGRDGSFVSFVGWEYDADGQTRGGIYVVQVEWVNGVPAAGPPTLVVGADAGNEAGLGWANVYEHDWSPDGTAVVLKSYTVNASGASEWAWYVARFADGGVVTNRLAAASSGGRAEWSPDGGRIAFGGNGVWTIKPDGTNAVRLTAPISTSKETRGHSSPTWSPDGGYLAFTEYVKSGSKETWSVIRIPSAGGTGVKLTADLAGGRGPVWRP
jgi:Tol biopolymer transport system component